ncbi:hypothetical protein BDW59DRAFT_158417 [Aspergillus cavernicola]|uniref:Transcription factor domain-containing protein n=1 Tax=Aspergillus cavernicola TaxID=176166 RepID=A0ABR4IUI8_9EURO
MPNPRKRPRRGDSSDIHQSVSGAAALSSPRRHASPPRDPGRDAFSQEQESATHHFVCDTNPVVTLLDDRESRLQKGRSGKGDVGAWLDHDSIHSQRDQRGFSSLTGREGIGQSTNVNGSIVLPPKVDVEALVNIYFDRIHPLLPLLDENEIRSQSANGTLSIPLLQTICLVASKDRSAPPFLRLGSDPEVLQQESFSERIHRDILKNMPRKEEKKRVLTIRILTLLSLHGWGPDGSEECALNLVQPPALKALFWSLWSLDRWNSAINGRPIIINERDMSQGVDNILSSFHPPFRVWLRLAQHLGEVIKSYRPIVDSSNDVDVDIPSFEEIVESCDAWDTTSELLDSLEFYYHALVILSTHSKNLQGRSHSRASQIRQSHSILTLASLCRAKNMRDLSPIPMSAYTLSLVFSITYKPCRESKLLSVKTLAKANLETFYQCLESLSSTWWLAAIMRRLGKHALDNLHRCLNLNLEPAPSSSATIAIYPTQPPGDSGIQASRDTQTTSTPSSSSSSAFDVQPPPPPNGLVQPQPQPQTPNPANNAMNVSEKELLVSALPPDFDGLFENSAVAGANPGYFDAFFDHFPDVNFPSSSSEQVLWDLGGEVY